MSLAITSGKGGVGKTMTTISFASMSQAMGKKILVLDADLGLSNVDVLVGVRSTHHLQDVIDGNISIEKVICEGPNGFHFIPSGSGVTKLVNMSYAKRAGLYEAIKKIEKNYDLVLMDTGAGISDNVLFFNQVAEHCLIVTSPEPHALTDAYALIKVMSQNYDKKDFLFCINQVKSEQEGLKIYEKFADICYQFLNIRLNFVGTIPWDPMVSKHVLTRKVGGTLFSQTIAAQAWSRLVNLIWSDYLNIKNEKNNQHDFWTKMLGVKSYANENSHSGLR